MNSICDPMSPPAPVKTLVEPWLSPQAHLDLLHPSSWSGQIAIGPLKATGFCLNRHAALEAAAAFAGAKDIYISQQRFIIRRRIDNLANLGCCYVDLDYHNEPGLKDFPPATVTQEVLNWLGQARLPSPSYILFSGRGLLVVWLHDYLPKRALSRWQAVQQHLRERLQRFGADAGACDAARLFRLAGTRNSKSGEMVRPTYLPDHTRAGARWTFDTLAQEVLPLDRAKLQELREQRQAKMTGSARPRPAGRHRDSGTYWRKVLEELHCLVAHRWPGGIPTGSRDPVIYFVACALAWIEPEPQFFPACLKWAQTWTPWSASELSQRISAVRSRAKQAAARAKTSPVGHIVDPSYRKKVDPRYRKKAATIVTQLRITAGEMRQLNLRVLCTPEIKRDRKRLLAEDERRAKGCVARHVYTAAAQARRVQIPLLRDDGLSWRQIARTLSISESEARRLGK